MMLLVHSGVANDRRWRKILGPFPQRHFLDLADRSPRIGLGKSIDRCLDRARYNLARNMEEA